MAILYWTAFHRKTKIRLGGGGGQPFAALIFEIPLQWVLKMYWYFIFCVNNILNPFSNGKWNLEGRGGGGGPYFTAIIFWTSCPIFIKNWKGFKYLKQYVLNPLSNRKRNNENSVYSIFCGHNISKYFSNGRAQMHSLKSIKLGAWLTSDFYR